MKEILEYIFGEIKKRVILCIVIFIILLILDIIEKFFL
jgi:hypothetical protein